MKRIIRLTESDLSRIIKRVLNEQKTLPQVAIECALTNFNLTDVTKIPMECITLGLTVIMTKELPDLTDPSVMGCATGIMDVVSIDGDARTKVINFAKCVLGGVLDGSIVLPIPGEGGEITVPGTDIKVKIPKIPGLPKIPGFPGINESRRRRYLREDEMNLSSVNKLSEIEGIDSIPECSTDNENFNSALCLSKAMDTLSFNTFVKEFFPTFQEIANVTKTPLQTTPMDLPSVAESRRRRYGRY
jgi:hypothetical protein